MNYGTCFVCLLLLSLSAGADDVYDYIVVGSGAAGSIVASRLAEDPSNEVIIFEAGGPSQRAVGGTDYVATTGTFDSQGKFIVDPIPLTRYDVPAMFTTTTWPALGTSWNIANATLGKLVGGCMVHNGMSWLRATPDTIDNWGVRGWSGNDLLYYYKKSENVTGSSVQGDNVHHGHDGPLQISDNVIWPIEAAIFVNSCIASGLPLNNNFNDDNGANDRIGCGPILHNVRNGVRESTASTYLAKSLSQQNLTLKTFAQVTRVLFEKNSNGVPVAVGVQYWKDSTLQTVRARKQVILSGGSINTAKLLMHSGIGPRDVLEKFHITPVSILENVGRNIRNHLLLFTSWASPKSNYPNMYNIGAETMKYAQTGTGVLAQAATFAGLSMKTLPDLEHADLDVFMNTRGNNAIGLTVSTAIAKYHHGHVNLVSSDPLVDPHFSSNLLAEDGDIDTLVRGLKAIRKIFSYAPANATFGPELVPGPLYQTDDQLKQWVKANINKHDHWYGSAKMGNANDSTAVVSPRLRVRGVNRLRVVDASVIPNAINGLMMANVVAVAEKGVAMILEDAE